MKKIDVNKTYTIFDRVKFEMLNWTGYNAELLDELVEAGNELIKQKDSAVKAERKYMALSTFEWVAGIGLVLLMSTLFVFFCWALLILPISSFRSDKLEAIAYRQGQVDVLTETHIVYEHTIHGYKLKEGLKDQPYSYTYNGKTYSFYFKE